MFASKRWAVGAGIGLILVAGALYLATLDTGLQPHELLGGDLITHQYAQVQARPSNAPGYPLYTMGGWLWFHGLRSLPFFTPGVSNPMPLLSSYSMLWALLALGLLYAIGLRLTRSPAFPAGNWPVVWLLCAFYAATYFFWFYATTTEQYSSAIAQTLGLIYLYLLWRDAQGAGADRLLLALAFLSGLSLAHMLTIAFFVPPLVLVILWQQPGLLRRPGMIAGAIGAAALPLLSYLYVYLRGAQHPEWRGAGDWDTTAQWFWSFVSTAQGREELGWAFEPGVSFFANGFPELVWQELSIPLLLLGLAGILLYDRRLVTLLYGGIGLTLLFSWAYRYGNWFQVILPAYPLILLGDMAVADGWMRFALGRSSAARRRLWQAVAMLPLLLLAVLVVWRLDASLPAADSRGRPEDTGLDRAAVLLDQPLPADAGLFAAVDDAQALHYLLDIWQVSPDPPRVVSSPQAATLLAQGRPVLATNEAVDTLLSELPGAPSAAIYSPDWVRLAAADRNSGSDGVSPPGDVSVTSVTFEVEPGVVLTGYHLRRAPDGSPVQVPQDGAGGWDGGLDLYLQWEMTTGGWPEGLAMSVRPLVGSAFIPDPVRSEEEPDAIVQVDASQPALGFLGNPDGTSGPLTVMDAVRLPGTGVVPDQVRILLYRTDGATFENVADIVLPVEDSAVRSR